LLFEKNRKKVREVIQKYKFNYELSTSSSDNIDPIFTKDGKMKFLYSYTYISIPISIRYRLLEKNRIEVGIRGGLSFDKFLSEEKEIIYGIDYGSNADFPNINFSAIIGCPIDYKINEKFGLLIEPQFNSMILDNEKSSASTSRLYGLGLNIGLIF
jgi:hypothetical protein